MSDWLCLAVATLFVVGVVVGALADLWKWVLRDRMQTRRLAFIEKHGCDCVDDPDDEAPQ